MQAGGGVRVATEETAHRKTPSESVAEAEVREDERRRTKQWVKRCLWRFEQARRWRRGGEARDRSSTRGKERRAVGKAGSDARTTMQTVQKRDDDPSCQDDVGLE